MKTGVIGLSVVPGRKEANDRAEMVTQLLFGEEYVILEETDKWLKIRCSADDYECWIDKKQHLESAPSEAVMTTRNIGDYWLNTESNEMITLCPGSIIREQPSFHLSFAGDIELVVPLDDDRSIAHLAHQFLNSPYLWGGKTSLGIDCSGLTQTVYRAAGIELPRDAWQQALKGTPVKNIQEAEKGDLAFFCSIDNQEKEPHITHVGIVLDDGWIIHASGWVRMDTLDDQGIVHRDSQTYSHRLLGIRRYEG